MWRTRCMQLRSFSSIGATEQRVFDVVIIGAGHNGLVAAGYLQKSGAKVCVLEKRNVVGGCAVTEEIVPGFRFSRASYVLSLLRPHIIQDLELKKHGLKVHLRNPNSYTPIHEKYWTSKDKTSLTLGSDEIFNAQQISRFSSKDAEAYPKYDEYLQNIVTLVNPLLDIPATKAVQLINSTLMQRIKMLIQDKQLRHVLSLWTKSGLKVSDLMELILSPASKIIDRWFESEPLKATLATDAVIGAMASPYNAGTGYVLLHHVMGELEGIKGAWGYPEGGMGSVTQSMADAASQLGAHIHTNKEVEQIVCNAFKEAVRVVTKDGEEYIGKVILSNATPYVTYLKLLPEGVVKPDQKQSIQSFSYTSPVTKINVALNKLPDFIANPCRQKNTPEPHHQTTIHMNCERMQLIDDAYQDALVGNVSKRPIIEMVIPSSLDSTLAPKGAHVCLIFTQFTPYKLKGQETWNETMKTNYAKQVFQHIDEYAPGFSSSIVGYEILAPPDLENIFSLTGGNIFHGAMNLDQLFLLRNGGIAQGPTLPHTFVKNLLICGSGAHPGGGVMGSPGQLAANEALKLLQMKKRT